MMHKDLLGRQGAMTRTEKGYNKGSPKKETAIDGVQKASMVVGFHNEYPIKNVAIAKALQRATSQLNQSSAEKSIGSLREKSQSVEMPPLGKSHTGMQSPAGNDYDPLLETIKSRPMVIDE